MRKAQKTRGTKSKTFELADSHEVFMSDDELYSCLHDKIHACEVKIKEKRIGNKYKAVDELEAKVVKTLLGRD